MSRTLFERLQNIDWLVLDVDGVLTDGGIVYDNAGIETKRFHVRDGSGLKIWNFLGKRAAIITGRTSKLVEIRAAELGISPVIQGAAEKLPAYRRFLAETGCPPERACAIGDDVPDLGVLIRSGLAVAVADACPEVRESAHYVTGAIGGAGAVRETIELILKAQGKWQAIVDRFRNESL
jgi:3-deoxy-D-manno-octulosonate 8-phosphate phosphatase (KDO 8-P phosphatase)